MIKVVIMNHDKPDNSDRLFSQLSGEFDVSLFDSGSTGKKAQHTTHEFGNLYWSGCWEKAMEIHGDADVLWVIGGDILMVNDAIEYKKALESLDPFGCWSPAIKGSCRPIMDYMKANRAICDVFNVEGMGMAVSGDLIQHIREYPKGNQFGWGLDLWMCYIARNKGMRNILDGRVIMLHPKHRGYSGTNAYDEMVQWMVRHLGANWRDKTNHWHEHFESNLIGVRDR